MYQGEVENGVPNGLGVLIYPDGGKYIGSWKNGEKYGHGTFTYSYGSKYVGSWENDERNGQGIMVFPDGSRYEGEYKNDWRRNGIRYYEDGDIWGKYVNGEWIDQSKKEGVLYFGSRYGEKGWYDEEWKGVKSEGNYDISKYEGGIIRIRNSLYPDRQGTFIYPNVGKYVGEYKYGKENGQGTFIYLNGDKYEGKWKDGKQDEGTHTWKDGYKYEGSWKGGQMWNGTQYDKDGNITKKVVNGKTIKQ